MRGQKPSHHTTQTNVEDVFHDVLLYLRHEADAVVERRHVSGRADVEVVRCRADGVGGGEDGGEVVGETAGGAGGALKCVRSANASHPRHANVVVGSRDGGDAEEGGTVGRVCAGLGLLKVREPVAVGVGAINGIEQVRIKAIRDAVAVRVERCGEDVGAGQQRAAGVNEAAARGGDDKFVYDE